MRRKQNLVTKYITKYKARMKPLSVNYFNTYDPVVTWFSIRLLIIIAMVMLWEIRQVDFHGVTPSSHRMRHVFEYSQ